jgi:flagellar motor switch protein FliN
MSRTPIDLFVEALPTEVAKALTAKASAPWTVKGDETPKPFPAGTQLLTMILVAEPSQAEAAIQISTENALALAAMLEKTAIAPGELQPGHAQAVRGVLAEACEKAAVSLHGIKIHLRVAKEITWTASSQFSLVATDGGAKSLPFQILFAEGWPQGSTTSEAAPSQVPQATKNFNASILENVEIEVTLQFGERRLPLREIGELRSGSVVELDKYIQDPAELFLGDRVVARGEVVVVDGNYGLRITEVV